MSGVIRSVSRIAVLLTLLLTACSQGGTTGTGSQTQQEDADPLAPTETQATTEPPATSVETSSTTAPASSTSTTTPATTDDPMNMRIPVGPSGCIGFDEMYDFPMDAIAIADADLPSWSIKGWYASFDDGAGQLEFFVYNVDGTSIDRSNLPEGMTISSDGVIAVETNLGPVNGTSLTLTFLPGEKTVNSALPGHASPCTN